MNLENFKTEYTKKEVVVNGVKFTINKIPAIKGAFVFTGLIKKLFGDIATIDMGNTDSGAIKAIILGLVSGLDVDYLENDLTPTLFGHINYSIDSRGLKNVNFQDCKVSIEDLLGFDDILEIILRGLCVNFLDATFAKMSKLLKKS